MNEIRLNFPNEIKNDLEIAISILKREGCKEIYIFGSLTGEKFSKSSDIDIATKGLIKKKYFKVYGELLEKVKRPIDLVGLDYDTKFAEKILETGNLTRIA